MYKPRNQRKYCLIFLLTFLALFGYGQAEDSLRVLFVGNSYTYFWNLPQNVEAIAAEAGMNWVVEQSTAGGASWVDHWDGEKELKSLDKIKKGWDWVVIQNHSMSGIEDYDKFINYGNKLVEHIRKNGAEPLLYVTWSRKFNPLMQEQITKAYEDLAKQTNTKMVPAGPIWREVNELRSDLELYDQDNSHPSPAGTYLNACIFYKVLSKSAMIDISHRIIGKDHRNEKLYLSIVPPNDARFLQQVVNRFFDSK